MTVNEVLKLSDHKPKLKECWLRNDDKMKKRVTLARIELDALRDVTTALNDGKKQED